MHSVFKCSGEWACGTKKGRGERTKRRFKMRRVADNLGGKSVGEIF